MSIEVTSIPHGPVRVPTKPARESRTPHVRAAARAGRRRQPRRAEPRGPPGSRPLVVDTRVTASRGFRTWRCTAALTRTGTPSWVITSWVGRPAGRSEDRPGEAVDAQRQDVAQPRLEQGPRRPRRRTTPRWYSLMTRRPLARAISAQCPPTIATTFPGSKAPLHSWRHCSSVPIRLNSPTRLPPFHRAPQPTERVACPVRRG